MPNPNTTAKPDRDRMRERITRERVKVLAIASRFTRIRNDHTRVLELARPILGWLDEAADATDRSARFAAVCQVDADAPLPSQREHLLDRTNAIIEAAVAYHAFITAGDSELLQRVLEVFKAAGEDRMHSEVLAAKLCLPSQWALADLMRGYGVRPRPEKFKRGGQSRRGYFLTDVRAAADAIARGHTPAPITTDEGDEGVSPR